MSGETARFPVPPGTRWIGSRLVASMRDPLFNDEVEITIKVTLHRDELKKLALLEVEAEEDCTLWPNFGDIVEVLTDAIANQSHDIFSTHGLCKIDRMPQEPIENLWRVSREKYGVLDQLADI